MRVGLIIYGSLQTVSGGYLYDRKLVEHLRHYGSQVEVFSQSWRSGNESIAYARRLADNLSTSFLRSLRLAKVDILLQDELNHPSLFWLNRRLLPAISYPIVAIVHHLRSSEVRPAWQNRFYRLIERRYLASVDGFVCNSTATLDQVTQLVGNGKPSLIARPAGDRWQEAEDGEHGARPLSKAQLEARAYMPGPLRVLFVGNLIPRKGLHTLLTAFSLLPPETATLTVVGDAGVDLAYAAACRYQVKRLNIAHRVAFRGRLPDAELEHELRSHQVLAAPSSYEGFGIVYLEGMGFGLPAIATSAGGAGEIVSDGENGFLLAPGDASALAGCLRRLHADRSLLARMGLAARRRFEAHPTWEETGTAIRRFLLAMRSAQADPMALSADQPAGI